MSRSSSLSERDLQGELDASGIIRLTRHDPKRLGSDVAVGRPKLRIVRCIEDLSPELGVTLTAAYGERNALEQSEIQIPESIGAHIRQARPNAAEGECGRRPKDVRVEPPAYRGFIKTSALTDVHCRRTYRDGKAAL
jgi:hypothetical protein